jgi:hypothetical protein
MLQQFAVSQKDGAASDFSNHIVEFFYWNISLVSGSVGKV